MEESRSGVHHGADLPSTARRAAISAILTDILSRLDRVPTSHTDNAARKSIYKTNALDASQGDILIPAIQQIVQPLPVLEQGL